MNSDSNSVNLYAITAIFQFSKVICYFIMHQAIMALSIHSSIGRAE